MIILLSLISELTIFRTPFLSFSDFIFSKISRNGKLISKFEKRLKTNLDNLRNVNKFLINDGGGTEFIHQDGIELFETIINDDFQKFNIKISFICCYFSLI